MPPWFDDPEEARPFFRTLRELRDRIKAEGIPRVEMGELSMGMTGDYAVAVEEGATIVRIGRGIFGEQHIRRTAMNKSAFHKLSYGLVVVNSRP